MSLDNYRFEGKQYITHSNPSHADFRVVKISWVFPLPHYPVSHKYGFIDESGSNTGMYIRKI